MAGLRRGSVGSLMLLYASCCVECEGKWLCKNRVLHSALEKLPYFAHHPGVTMLSQTTDKLL